MRHRPLRLLAAGALVLSGVVAACIPQSPPATLPSTSSTTTTAPQTANQQSMGFAADWLLAQFNTQGSLPSARDPDVADLGNQVLAIAQLAALDVGGTTAATRWEHLEAHAEDYIDEGAGDRAGALARVIMAAVAAGEDPRHVGGSDLVARLEATIQPIGLFGAQYAGFDGAFRHGLALAALSLITPRPASITPGPGRTIDDLPVVAWLQDQQCSDGSWLMFRASIAAPCVENPAMGTFKDPNGTALAVLGLRAVGADPDVDPMTWLTAVRGDDGGWGTSPAGPTTESDADSTGLVIAAIESLGATPDPNGYAALRGFQLGASSPAADRGAFQWKRSAPGPNRLATLDAMTALFDEVWPAALLPD
ncbi:MAG: hypothetical protein ACYC2O_06295 [Microthrixaceae bacterium]